MIFNNKIFLRTKYLNERLSMEKKEVNSLSYSVTNKLQKLKIWNKTYYHIYNSIEKNNELSTYFLINFLFAKQKQIIIPKIQNNRLIHFNIDHSTNFELNNFGIKEPIDGTQIDIEKIGPKIENHKKTKQDKEYNAVLDKFSQGEELTLEEREVLKNYKK